MYARTPPYCPIICFCDDVLHSAQFENMSAFTAARTNFADAATKAIGQKFLPACIGDSGVTLTGGRIAIDEERRTSVAKIWAGGDCVDGGEDLTVSSVEDGKLAAESIHRALTA